MSDATIGETGLTELNSMTTSGTELTDRVEQGSRKGLGGCTPTLTPYTLTLKGKGHTLTLIPLRVLKIPLNHEGY